MKNEGYGSDILRIFVNLRAPECSTDVFKNNGRGGFFYYETRFWWNSFLGLIVSFVTEYENLNLRMVF